MIRHFPTTHPHPVFARASQDLDPALGVGGLVGFRVVRSEWGARTMASARGVDSQRLYKFPNGYGASIITGEAAGGYPGEYEIAVLLDGRLVYSTPVTSDVVRGDAYEMNRCLYDIEHLPPPAVRVLPCRHVEGERRPYLMTEILKGSG